MARVLYVVGLTAAFFASQGRAAELVLPQGKGAFYAGEAIELAVAGLAQDATATLELVPQGNGGLGAVSLLVQGDGSTVTFVLPPMTLAPGKYAVRLDGRPSPVEFVVSSGVNISTMLLSQAANLEDVKPLGGNFILGNAFVFGLIGPDGMPSRDPRGRSAGLAAFDRAVALDLPTVVYMYWTGYVTHKPWGNRKGWAEQTMSDTMRMFSLHTAQRLRRYRKNVAALGTIDEPGLGPGKTPDGTWASGYANWDSAPWYERRGWTFTDDPGSRPDADWLKYASIRGGIIGAQQAQARDDLKRVWPDVVFSADNYAAHAVMDGAEPMNQGGQRHPRHPCLPGLGRRPPRCDRRDLHREIAQPDGSRGPGDERPTVGRSHAQPRPARLLSRDAQLHARRRPPQQLVAQLEPDQPRAPQGGQRAGGPARPALRGNAAHRSRRGRPLEPVRDHHALQGRRRPAKPGKRRASRSS